MPICTQGGTAAGTHQPTLLKPPAGKVRRTLAG